MLQADEAAESVGLRERLGNGWDCVEWQGDAAAVRASLFVKPGAAQPTELSWALRKRMPPRILQGRF